MAISGPMDVKHVGGVNVMNGNVTGLDKFFPNTAPEPEPSTAYESTAPMPTQLPKRPGTLPGTYQRPSLLTGKSLPKLATRSLWHLPETNPKIENENHSEPSITRSDSVRTLPPFPKPSTTVPPRKKIGVDRDTVVLLPLPKPSKTVPPRKKVGLDRDTIEPVSATPKPSDAEPEIVPKPISKDPPQSNSRSPMTHANTVSSFNSTTKPVPQESSPVVQNPIPKPIRSRRTDSGTAIDIHDVPVQERPVPFKEILAVQTLADRMAMYKKSRDYWATADHGLLDWTERAAGWRVISAYA